MKKITVAELRLGVRVTVPFDGVNGLEQVTGTVMSLEYPYCPPSPGEAEDDTYIVIREDDGKQRFLDSRRPTDEIELAAIDPGYEPPTGPVECECGLMWPSSKEMPETHNDMDCGT